MPKFDQEKFNQFIIHADVVGFFEDPITLKSGRKSHWYVNWRSVAEDAFLTDQLTDYILDFTEDRGLNPDTFYGVPEGATKPAIIAQMKLASRSPNFSRGSHVLSMGRGKPKAHGDPKDRYFLGMPQGNTIIVEDVTTTGGSLISTIDSLAEAQIPIIGAIGLTNRMELTPEGIGVKQAIKERGVPYLHMSSGIDLLPVAYRTQTISKEVAEAVEAEFREHGVAPVKLI